MITGHKSFTDFTFTFLSSQVKEQEMIGTMDDWKISNTQSASEPFCIWQDL